MKYLYDQQIFLVKLQLNQGEILGTLGDSMEKKKHSCCNFTFCKTRTWVSQKLEGSEHMLD